MSQTPDPTPRQTDAYASFNRDQLIQVIEDLQPLIAHYVRPDKRIADLTQERNRLQARVDELLSYNNEQVERRRSLEGELTVLTVERDAIRVQLQDMQALRDRERGRSR